MKRILALMFSLVLLASLLPTAAAGSVEYIPAPHTIEDPTKGPTEYLEPVFYENADGPTIGVTLVGVLKVDGLYFKDSNNNQELDVFEDWRLDTATRVADLLPKLSKEQRLGMMHNQLRTSPTATTAADVYDENGKVIFTQLMLVTPDALNMVIAPTLAEGEEPPADLPETAVKVEDAPNSTGMILTFENRSGVLRKTTDAEVGALWNNATNMVVEYGTVAKNQPAVPFTIISNPQNAIGIPGSQGMAAAVMGDLEAGGDYSLFRRYVELDRQIWDAKGIDGMYGPQIDLITDPRWTRNGGTYTEVVDVMVGIAKELTLGYQDGQPGGVSLTMKHFPGDGAAYNGFESHSRKGQWRIYATEGSLEKYHLPAFQASIDAGLTGIMPGYSRPTLDGRSANQTYRGVDVNAPAIANAYNEVLLQTLLRDTMGFKGYINTDSGVITRMEFGAEEMTIPQRMAANINAGSDVIGDSMGSIDYASLFEAFDAGMITPEAYDRATIMRLNFLFDMERFENPYRDPAESKALLDSFEGEISALSKELNEKSVVLMKNKDKALPLVDTSKKVFIASFNLNGKVEETEAEWKAEFEAAGFTVVDNESEADVAFLTVAPGGVSNSNLYMSVIDLVDGMEVDERPNSDNVEKSGNKTEATTLMDVAKIAKISETVHANGGTVVANITISAPWILTNLEPHVDALLGVFRTTLPAQMSVITGAYNPTGKLPITMVSSNEVIAVVETEINGEIFEICVSPNDVPGYDKDQYIAAEVLAQSPSGSYAYKDSEGNLYKAWFGLSY